MSKTVDQLEVERRMLPREVMHVRQTFAAVNLQLDRLGPGAAQLKPLLAHLQTEMERCNEQLLSYAEQFATAVRRAEDAEARAEVAQQERAFAERRVAAATRLVIDVLLIALEHRAPGSQAHARRVATWARAVGPALGVDEVGMSLVRIAALLHDIGVLTLPVLPLPDPARGGWQPEMMTPAASGRWQETPPLTRSQQAVVWLHVPLGAALLEQFSVVAPVASLVLAHHERWDGHGYPAKRMRIALNPQEQALALAEAFDGIVARATPGTPLTTAWVRERLESAIGDALDTRIIEALREAWVQSAAEGS